jgi:hypothetical protein
MFKKKEKTEKAPKNKKVRTMKVGTHKKSVLLLWAVLLASTSFGVYKNFTAIDTHTVHEKEIIQLRLNDTNGIENFVKNFAKAYYSWDTSKEAIEARTTEISKYLTKELQDLNADTIRTDIPTSATVTNVLVWNVEQSGTDDFTVDYEVDQQVKEGEQTQAVTENYTVTVHVDKDGAMVITQNPTLAPAVQKSKYEPKVQEADVSVSSDTVKDATAFLETFFKLYPTATEKELAYYVKDGVLAPVSGDYVSVSSDTVKDVTAFLETFFKLYPTATEKELAYYVKDGVLAPVSGDYVFSELVNPVFTKDGDNLKVSVSVKYLDNKSKMTQISQYELVLHKDDNWKIVE